MNFRKDQLQSLVFVQPLTVNNEVWTLAGLKILSLFSSKWALLRRESGKASWKSSLGYEHVMRGRMCGLWTRRRSNKSGWLHTLRNCITRFMRFVVACWASWEFAGPEDFTRSSILIFFFQAKRLGVNYLRTSFNTNHDPWFWGWVMIKNVPVYNCRCRLVSGQWTRTSILSDNSFSTSFLILPSMNGFRIKWSLDRCSVQTNTYTQW